MNKPLKLHLLAACLFSLWAAPSFAGNCSCKVSRTFEPSRGDFAELFNGDQAVPGARWGSTFSRGNGPTGQATCEEAIHCCVQTDSDLPACLRKAEKVSRCKWHAGIWQRSEAHCARIWQ